MSPTEHARAQPEGRARAKPGTKGEGKYYRIVVRPKEEFVTFRYHDVGRPGHIQRLAGKRSSGSWDDQAWLINKEDAHVKNGELVLNCNNKRYMVSPLVTVNMGKAIEKHYRQFMQLSTSC